MKSFIEKPNLPEKKVKTVVIDYRASREIISSLQEMNIEIIKTECCENLYDAIKGHPDILTHHIGGNKIVLAPNIYDKMAEKFLKKGFAVTKGSTWLHRNYPYNIAYNVLRIGKYAFHNTKYTDSKILSLYEQIGVELIHVNQGYTKCSVCVVNEEAAITSDMKIARALELCGVEALLIKPQGIELQGFDYGFIGGTSGLISKSEIAFTGCLYGLEDYKRIKEFLAKKRINTKILSKKKIIDLGSLMPLIY